MKNIKNKIPVGIVSTAFCLPQRQELLEDIIKEEGLENNSENIRKIGIEQVHVFEGPWRSDLALAAAKECLLKAGMKANEIDVIVDYSVMPQDYVVPSWCMSNKIQHELGASKAFNLGFGGGGTTNLLVALKFVASLLKTGEINTAMLISSDVAIPGNRIINRETPHTVLGDGASALIVGNERISCEILNIDLWSDGGKHDICCVPAGGLIYPDRLDLYRLRLDTDAYSDISTFRILKGMTERAAKKVGISMEELTIRIHPNISAKDSRLFNEMFGLSGDDSFSQIRRSCGHIQATDIVINLSQILDARRGEHNTFGVVNSHGWGFLYGAMMLRI